MQKELPEGQTLSWGFKQEYPLSVLIQKTGSKEGLFTDAELRYMQAGARLDFLIFDRMDKEPLAAIEVDGEAFHQPGTKAAENDAKKDSILRKVGLDFIRLRTRSADGQEMEKVKALLKKVIEERNISMI